MKPLSPAKIAAFKKEIAVECAEELLSDTNLAQSITEILSKASQSLSNAVAYAWVCDPIEQQQLVDASIAVCEMVEKVQADPEGLSNADINAMPSILGSIEFENFVRDNLTKHRLFPAILTNLEMRLLLKDYESTNNTGARVIH
jgi:hypothetical protein